MHFSRKIIAAVNFITVLTGIIIMQACNNRADHESFDYAKKYLADSIIIENADLSTSFTSGSNLSYNVSIPASPVLWYFGKNFKVYKYDLLQKKIKDSIDLTVDSGIYHIHTSFYVDTAKRLYMLYHGEDKKALQLNPPSRPNSILVIANGKRTSINYQSNDSPKAFLYDANTPLFIGSNILFCKQQYYKLFKPSERIAYFSKKILGIFRINDSSLVETRNFATFPEEYKEKFFHIQMPVACLAADSMIFYCFSTNNTIYKYNIYSDKTDEVILSNVMKNNIFQFDDDSITSFHYAINYSLTTDNYTSLSYDRISGNTLLFRTLALKNNKPDASGHVPIYDDKPVIAYVLDNKFNCIKRLMFNFQIYSKTYLYYNNKLYIPTFNNHQLKILIYAL